jgi:hypothetical protein
VHDGHTKWTTKPENDFDPSLFRNGGYSYWETKQLPYIPAMPKEFKRGVVCLAPRFLFCLGSRNCFCACHVHAPDPTFPDDPC